tara:strand:+ start:1433 stop:1918 length:486 start_codon:yes stop_codon:yes gene_type:complete
MSDSDNYFSDSDKSIDNNENDTLQQEEEESDYEMDEETRRIIYEASKKNVDRCFFDGGSVPKKEKKPKKKKEKDVKYLTFDDFQKKLEEEKPKKWKSNRSLNKKEELGIVTRKITKRRFNPRLPIPTVDTFKRVNRDIDGKEDVNPDSDEQFPSLDKSIVV